MHVDMYTHIRIYLIENMFMKGFDKTMMNPETDAESNNEVSIKQQRPATKAARLNAIEQALLAEVITSQSQLAKVLARHGFNVTQATLSRDLDELNAVKIRLTDGRIAYVLGDGTGNRHAMDTVRFDQKVARNLVCLVTEVGHAYYFVFIDIIYCSDQ